LHKAHTATTQEARLDDPAPYLTVQIRHRLGRLKLDVDFALSKPWTVLFGPSGSGKTTILRAIAGLLQPDFAQITSTPGPPSSPGNSFVMIDSASGTFSPAHKRGVILAAQRPTLFPHLTVLENMTYGYRGAANSGERDDLPERIAKLPPIFQIEHLLDRRPDQLSGGEVQRVSLARAAMARHKRVLLLDEPFTGLDFPLRDSLIANVIAWQEEYRTPILSVTHDVAEAFQLDAEVIKLAEGHVAEQGPVATVLAGERARLLEQLSPAE